MNNQTTGTRTSDANHLTLCDRLPPKVREVICRAPYNLATTNWIKGLGLGGLDMVRVQPSRARKLLIAAIVSAMRRSVRDEYGSEHPQACQDGPALAPRWERETARKRRTA